LSHSFVEIIEKKEPQRTQRKEGGREEPQISAQLYARTQISTDKKKEEKG
jgi:hypothetical protein